MNILLLNAGSSSLKCALVDSTTGVVVARSTADWAGPSTRYVYVGPDGQEQPEEVSWRDHRSAVRQTALDLLQTKPIALPGVDALAAVGHRVVHGAAFHPLYKLRQKPARKLQP